MKPEKMEIQVKNIPEELKSKPQWVVWKWELRDGKWTKPPFNPNTGNLSKTTDPKTWSDFKSALCGYQFGGWDGVGFMLNGLYCGVDFDHSRDEKTGEIKEPTKSEIINLNSYTEISPSGKGFKTLTKAKLPKGGHHSNGVGLFCEGRYFCITGRALEDVSLNIEERQTEIDALIKRKFPEDLKESKPLPGIDGSTEDVTLIEKIKNSKRGHEFARLWSGNIGGFASQSEADFCLCGILAFWTQNNFERIDSLFRQCGLMREKWDVKHSGDGKTYGEMTILKAIERTPEVYQGKTASLRMWLDECYGIFTIEQIYRDLGIASSKDKNLIRVNLSREVEKRVIERLNTMGTYKKVDSESEAIPILDTPFEPMKIKIPGEVERLVQVYAGNIVIIAGSPNAGKTAFDLNFAIDNAGTHEVVYFSSEIGSEELTLRIKKFNRPVNDWKGVDFRKRTHDFHQVVRPDAVNIIDYLEVIDGEFFRIGDNIRRIFEKLNRGIALISLQMDTGGRVAWGGQKTLDKARLYLTLDRGVMTIEKGKNRASKENPNGLARPFKLIEGCKFLWKDWQRASPTPKLSERPRKI